MGAYDPLSYHNGSVWPHDTALCAAGAARYGRWELVDQIIDGALAATSYFGGRPPELFAGVGGDDVPVPVAYPSSSSPQAWASASVLLLLSSRLGLSSPSEPGGAPTISRPSLVDVSNLDIDGINSGGTRYRIRTSGDLATIEPSTR